MTARLLLMALLCAAAAQPATARAPEEIGVPGGSGAHRAIAEARAATAWLDWQLKGNADAGHWFAAPHCRLCTTDGWTVQTKHSPELP